VEFEYRRDGTLAYRPTTTCTAQVIERIAPKAGIEPFEQLVQQVMSTEPYASARRVFWTWTTAPRTTDRPQSSG
jgi:hypothetical protein